MKSVFRRKNPDGGSCSFVLDDKVSLPSELGDHDLRLKVKACGLSKSDVQTVTDKICRTYTNNIPVGHEVAGVVTEVGTAVKTFEKGSRVAGLLPLDWPYSGLAEECIISEYDTVILPDTVSYTDAAGLLGDGVKAYSALYYLGRACAGDTILIVDAASSWASVAVQLAQSWGTKVLGTVSSDEEKYHLDELPASLGNVFEVHNGLLTSAVLEETGGIGVDVIIAENVKQFMNEEDEELTALGDDWRKYPSKHELISCLAVGGRLITSQSNLQLDPPHSEMLYLRGATVGFLFPGCWSLSASQYGRFQHMMKEIITKLSKRTLNPNIKRKIPVTDALEVLPYVCDQRVGKIVVEL